MLLDALSSENYLSINISLIKALGIEEAVYCSELINIYRKATNKNKLDANGYFTVDRNYIQERTGITPDKQRLIDNVWSSVGWLMKDERHKKIKLDTDSFLNLITDPIGFAPEIDIVNKQHKEDSITQDNGAFYGKMKTMMKVVKYDDCIELKNAFREWIISLLKKQGWTTQKIVIAFQEELDRYMVKHNNDLDLALLILKEASTYAIMNFKDVIPYAENKLKDITNEKVVEVSNKNNLKEFK